MRPQKTVMGVCAPGIRLTAWGALLLAVGLSVPVFVVLSLIGLVM